MGLPHKWRPKGDPSPCRVVEMQGSARGLGAIAVGTSKQGKVMDPVQGPSGEPSEEYLEKGDTDETGYEATAQVHGFLS